MNNRFNVIYVSDRTENDSLALRLLFLKLLLAITNHVYNL